MLEPGANGKLNSTDAFDIVVEWWNFVDCNMMLGIHVYESGGSCLFDIHSEQQRLGTGVISGRARIPAHLLSAGAYYLSVDFIKDKAERLFNFEACLSFDIEVLPEIAGHYAGWNGFLQPEIPVMIND